VRSASIPRESSAETASRFRYEEGATAAAGCRGTGEAVSAEEPREICEQASGIAGRSERFGNCLWQKLYADHHFIPPHEIGCPGWVEDRTNRFAIA